MSKTYLPYEPDQQLLLPAALQEWLPDEPVRRGKRSTRTTPPRQNRLFDLDSENDESLGRTV